MHTYQNCWVLWWKKHGTVPQKHVGPLQKNWWVSLIPTLPFFFLFYSSQFISFGKLFECSKILTMTLGKTLNDFCLKITKRRYKLIYYQRQIQTKEAPQICRQVMDNNQGLCIQVWRNQVVENIRTAKAVFSDIKSKRKITQKKMLTQIKITDKCTNSIYKIAKE